MKKSHMIAFAAALVSLFSCINADVEVETISLGDSNLYVEVGKTLVVNAVIVPETASKAVLTWTVDDPSVATVSQSGLVSGNKVGKTRLTVRAQNGVIATGTIHVTEEITGMELPANVTIYVGGSTPLKPVFTPSEAYSTALLWNSSDPSVATVSQNGIVTGVNGGYADVTATYGSYVSTCRVKVREAATGVTLDRSEAHMSVGETLEMIAHVTPDESVDYDIVWTSSDENVARVDGNGKVAALSRGEADIKVCVDGKHEASCRLTVRQPVTSLYLDRESLEIYPGAENSFVLGLTVGPEDADNPGVKWSSSDPSVASVDQNGRVTGGALGQAVISVISEDNPSLTAYCNVLVHLGVSSVSLDIANTMIFVGRSFDLSKYLNVEAPDFVTDRNVDWVSSDPSVAAVDENGTVTALKCGETEITVTSRQEPKKSASCRIIVGEDGQTDMEGFGNEDEFNWKNR